MNRLAFAATMLLPSVVLAHPGHSHAAMSANHHLVELGVMAAIAIGGYVATRIWRQARSR